VGFLNAFTFGRHEFAHLHGLFFCLRLGRYEEHALARRLCDIATRMPKAGSGCWQSLQINGQPALIAESAAMWSNVTLIARDRLVPDASWDPKGTLEFSLHLPPRWLRTRAALLIQVRGARAWAFVLSSQLAHPAPCRSASSVVSVCERRWLLREGCRSARTL